jgi:hypothetical protein
LCVRGVRSSLTLPGSHRGTDVAVKRVLPTEEYGNERIKTNADVESSGSLHEDTSEYGGRSTHLGPYDSGSMHMIKTANVPGSGTFVMRSGSAGGWNGRNLRSNFISEMKIVSRLRHPNITTVMVGNDKGLPSMFLTIDVHRVHLSQGRIHC